MSEFKVGDVVRLKSGSPKMTIEKIADSFLGSIVACSYCNYHTKEIKTVVFPTTGVLVLDRSL